MAKNTILRELVNRHAPVEVKEKLQKLDDLEKGKRDLNAETSLLEDDLLGRTPVKQHTCESCRGTGMAPKGWSHFDTKVETAPTIQFPARVAA